MTRDLDELKNVIEAALFSAGEPLQGQRELLLWGGGLAVMALAGAGNVDNVGQGLL